ncbi:uncharacterized protein FFB14_05775 [Fusarium fujikuroi]|nr:uncharacterized protein FFB14_05775 [Fusarium fujikuroi]
MALMFISSLRISRCSWTLRDDPAGPGDMAPVLDLWTAFDTILKAHGKQYSINSTKNNPENASRYRQHVLQRRQLLALQNGSRPLNNPAQVRELWVVALEAFVHRIWDTFEKDQTLGGNWIKDKIDTIPVRAPRFVPDDITGEASGV